MDGQEILFKFGAALAFQLEINKINKRKNKRSEGERRRGYNKKQNEKNEGNETKRNEKIEEKNKIGDKEKGGRARGRERWREREKERKREREGDILLNVLWRDVYPFDRLA